MPHRPAGAIVSDRCSEQNGHAETRERKGLRPMSPMRNTALVCTLDLNRRIDRVATPPVPAGGVWVERTVPFCGRPDNGSCCALGSGEVEGGEPICPSASARGRTIHPTQINRPSLFIRRSAGIKSVQPYSNLPGISSQNEKLPLGSPQFSVAPK